MGRSLLVAAVAGACGAAAALGIGAAAGWIGSGETVRSVTTTKIVPIQAGQGVQAGQTILGTARSGFDPAAVYEQRSPGVVTIYAYFGAAGDTRGSTQGSGFVVSEDGHILTNAHVITNVGDGKPVRGARRLYVEFQDLDRVPAEIVGWDLFNDVGVIRIDPRAHALAPLPLGNSALVAVGEPVAAIGSPFGNQNSLAVGVVSATGRSIPSLTSGYAIADAIQIDAPINHGNSGGPLLEARGSAIGINAQINSTSGEAEGVGFAVPINSARRSLEQLISTGRVAYAYVGVRTEDVTPGLARRFGFSAERGALISEVRPGGPAEAAGLRGGSRRVLFNGLTVTVGGDLVVAIGGVPVGSAEDLVRLVAERHLPGQTVAFTILRGGTKRASVDVTFAERRADPQP